MKKITFLKSFLFLMLIGAVACNENNIPDNPDIPVTPDDPISGSAGVESIEIGMPKMSRFLTMLEGGHSSVYIHLKGAENGVEHSFLSEIEIKDREIVISTEVDSLSRLNKQEYFLNYISHGSLPDGVSSAEHYQGTFQDSIALGAMMKIDNSKKLKLVSSLNEQSDDVGSGTEGDPYMIVDEASFVKYVIEGTLDGYYKQSKDLAIYSQMTAIGYDTKSYFNGNYDGSNYSITGLYINEKFREAGALFYGLGSDAYICDLELIDVSVSSVGDAAVLATYSTRGATLVNIYVRGGAVRGAVNIGGLIANGDANLESCRSTVSVYTTAYDTGCVGGFIGTSASSTIKNCYYGGLISAESSAARASHVGGIVGLVGLVDQDVYDSKKAEALLYIEDCYVSGAIAGFDCVGGIVGVVFLAHYEEAEDGNIIIRGCKVGDNLLDFDFFDKPVPQEIRINGRRSVGGIVGAVANDIDDDDAEAEAMKRTCCQIIDCEITSPTGLTYAYTVDAEENYIGGIVGCATHVNLYIENSHNYRDIRGGGSVGGVVGDMRHSSFAAGTKLENSGDVHAFAGSVGGVIGCLRGDENDVINNVTMLNWGNVGSDKKCESAGGVIGVIAYPYEFECDGKYTLLNEGSITGCDNVGGLVGSMSISSVIDMVNSGVSTQPGSICEISGEDNVGGLFGYAKLSNPNFSFDKIQLSTNVSGVTGIGGFFGALDFAENELTKESSISFNDGSVSMHISGSKSDVGGYIGRFTNMSSSEFNLHVDNAYNISITASGNSIGGVVGRITKDYEEAEFPGKVYLTNCYNNINISASSSGCMSNVGGLVGNIQTDTYISLGFNKGEINAGQSGSNGAVNIGGIVGTSLFAVPVTIDEVFNSAKLTGDNHIGGIIGDISSDSSTPYSGYVYIHDTYNTGEISSTGNQVAGLVGYTQYRDDHFVVSLSSSYNNASTLNGTMGGDNDLSQHEVDRWNCCYVKINDGCEDDLSIYGEAIDEVSLSELLNDELFSADKWGGITKNDGIAPYLKNLRHQ